MVVDVVLEVVVFLGWIGDGALQFDPELKTHVPLHKVHSPLHQSENFTSHSEQEFALWPPQFTPSKINFNFCTVFYIGDFSKR